MAALALSSNRPSAQNGGFDALLGSSSSSFEVEAETVVARASASFRVALESELNAIAAAGHEPGLDPGRHGELLDDFGAEYEARLEREVALLQGDGVLLSDEVSEAFERLRAGRLERLRDVALAEATGHEAPPARSDFQSPAAFRWAVTRYTFAERNSWLDWGRLGIAALAGLLLAMGVLKASGWKLGESGGGRWKALVRDTVDSLNGPLYLLFAMGGLALGTTAVWLPASVYGPTRTTILILVVIAVFWMGWRLTTRVPRRVGAWVTPSGESPGQQVLEISSKLLKLALIVVFSFLGVKLVFGADVTTILAGLGLAGVVVTLAAQDTLKDLFAAATIHFNQPFRLGELVRIEGYFGRVEEIGFRMTRVRTLDGHLVTIPNARLVNGVVENVDARPHIRRRFHIDLPYDTAIDRVSAAVEAIQAAIRDTGRLDEDQEVQVHFDEFGPHSMRLLCQYYFETGDYWAAKEHATEVDLAIVERLRSEEVEFAFPTQTLHVVPEEPWVEGDGQPEEEEDDSDEDDERESDEDS